MLSSKLLSSTLRESWCRETNVGLCSDANQDKDNSSDYALFPSEPSSIDLISSFATSLFSVPAPCPCFL